MLNNNFIYKITIDRLIDGESDNEEAEIFCDNEYELNYEAYLAAIEEETEMIRNISKEDGVHSFSSIIRLLAQDIVNDNNWITIHKSDIKFVKTR